MNRRKVFFLINSIGFGGAERALVNLLSIPGLYKGLDVRIVLLDNEHLARSLPSNIKVHQLDAKRSLLLSLWQLSQLLKKEQPSLVVSFLVRANVCNALLRKANSHNAVLCERMHLSSHLNNQFTGIKRFFASLLPWLAYHRADAVIGVSSGVTKDLVEKFRVNKDRAHTFFNPYNIESIEAASLEEPEVTLPDAFIISIGRLTEAKNFKQLINAYLISKETAHLCILGEGEQKDELKEFIKSKGAEKKVILLGYAKNPFSIISRAKYYISASTNEGFPNALLEAMALGLPAIMTNCPSGPAEILEDEPEFNSDEFHLGKFGILVPMNNENQLALAINQMQIESTYSDYSAKSKLRSKDFHIDKISSEFWQFIKRLV